MKTTRTLLALALCAALLLGAVPAGAATLVSTETVVSTQPTPESVKPYSTNVQSGISETSVRNALDDNAATNWQHIGWSTLSRDEIPEATFHFYGFTLGAVWIRAGSYISEEDFWAHARPRQVKLRVYTGSTTRDYAYLLDDVYDPYTVSSDWFYGYQKLALPQSVSNVTQIDLFVSGWKAGDTYTHYITISDILFCPPGSSSSTTTITTPPSITAPPTWTSTAGQPIQTTLSQRLATRSGPGTTYTELGSYFAAGDPITVISRAFDSRNRIWWVQVEFKYKGTPRRAYTGVKRVNVNLENVELDTLTGSARVTRSTAAWWGPGNYYTKYDSSIPSGTIGTVYNIENGYAQFEYTPSNSTQTRRVWVSVGDLNINY